MIAPALGCLAVKQSYDMYGESGEKMRTTTNTVTAIVFGDPAAELFEIPANYVESTPGEAMALALP